MANEKPQIRISDVLRMLQEEGKTRPEIGEHYGLNGVQLKKLFQHEELKGKKTRKAPEEAFVIINDVSGDETPEETPDTEEGDTEEELSQREGSEEDEQEEERVPEASENKWNN